MPPLTSSNVLGNHQVFDGLSKSSFACLSTEISYSCSGVSLKFVVACHLAHAHLVADSARPDVLMSLVDGEIVLEVQNLEAPTEKNVGT